MKRNGDDIRVQGQRQTRVAGRQCYCCPSWTYFGTSVFSEAVSHGIMSAQMKRIPRQIDSIGFVHYQPYVSRTCHTPPDGLLIVSWRQEFSMLISNFALLLQCNIPNTLGNFIRLQRLAFWHRLQVLLNSVKPYKKSCCIANIFDIPIKRTFSCSP